MTLFTQLFSMLGSRALTLLMVLFAAALVAGVAFGLSVDDASAASGICIRC